MRTWWMRERVDTKQKKTKQNAAGTFVFAKNTPHIPQVLSSLGLNRLASHPNTDKTNPGLFRT